MGLFDDVNIEKIYEQDSDWWQQPVSFREFVTSKEHMGHPGLTDKQYRMFEDFVGSDPKTIFHKLPDTPFDKRRSKHVKVLRLAKGSGKDLASSMFQNYVFYVTLCMTNPTAYFNFPANEEHLDIVNVGQSQTQAIKVFFKRFTTRLKAWTWAKKHFRIIDHGRVLNPECEEPRHEIYILDASVACSNTIHFHSLHTASQGFEGLNVLMFTMDEPSAFEDYEMYDKEGRKIVRSRADDLYDVLRTSASSRNIEWIGVMIAYPRRPDCFITRMYDYAISHPESDVCAETGLQWDYLPPDKFSGEWVEWEGYRIPKEKLIDARTDPESFKIKYLCITEKQVGKYFKLEDYKPCLIEGLDQIGEFVDEVKVTETGRKYLYKSLDFWKNIPDAEFVLAGDYSTVNDRTVIGIGHAEEAPASVKAIGEYDKMVCIDLLLIWQPDPKKEIIVSHSSIVECVSEIMYRLDIRHASLDQLESALTLETFNSANIPADKHNINDNDYLRLRNLCRAGLFKAPYLQLLFDEFGNVQYFPKRKRVDHTSDGSKDVLDVCCQIARILYTFNLTPSLAMSTFNSSQVSAQPSNLLVSQGLNAEDEIINPDDWSNLLTQFAPV